MLCDCCYHHATLTLNQNLNENLLPPAATIIMLNSSDCHCASVTGLPVTGKPTLAESISMANGRFPDQTGGRSVTI